MKIDDEDDFGFSLVTSEELKNTDELTKLQMKLEGVVKMIMPLLNNLMANPEKEFIQWPDRVDKIKKFKAKLEKYMKE